MKKALCFLLVILLLFPGGVLAVEETDEMAPAVEDEVTVQMRVPSSGQVLVNPYRYPVDTGCGTTDEQIISSTQYLVSRSNAPISVSVEVEGTHSDPDARFVTDEPDPTAKELFLYAEFQPVEGDEEPAWIGYYIGADCQVLINQSKADAVTIPSGEDTPGEVAFKLFGAVSAESEKGWTSDDALSVKINYKFVPLGETETSDTLEEENSEAQTEGETPEIPEESGAETEEPGQETAQESEKSGEAEAETESSTEQTTPVETTTADEESSRIEDTDRTDSFSCDESDTMSSHDDDEKDTEDDDEEESDGLPSSVPSSVTEDSVKDELPQDDEPEIEEETTNDGEDGISG